MQTHVSLQAGNFHFACKFGGLKRFACSIFTIKGLKIVILGAAMYEGTQQETSKFLHLTFEGRKYRL